MKRARRTSNASTTLLWFDPVHSRRCRGTTAICAIAVVDCVFSAWLKIPNADVLSEAFAEVGAPRRTADNPGERLKGSSQHLN
jgi:hypothetical protein